MPELYLVKPTRYDDDGYPLQWRLSLVPSNSLACVAGLARDTIERGVLQPFGEIKVRVLDEINTLLDIGKIVAAARTRRVVVFLVGVQTNQFPRAMDIARPLRAAGVPVCIGGFHVSGCLSMLKTLPDDLIEAQALGISFFAGEAEERRLDEVLRDGFSGAFKPVYNHLSATPNLAGEPIPLLHRKEIAKTSKQISSFDLGRGCPFECSFCTIINVQGRKSRFRTPDDLERIVRDNAAAGISRFFLTDDNFARNKHWEPLLDRLIALKAEGLQVHLHVQVDTVAYKIAGFIDKLEMAGGSHVFIGLENINSDNLEASKKRQNRIEDYKEMVLAWKTRHFVVSCGYIVGFPGDTKASLMRDVETIKRELAIDNIYLNYLTPLPGSEDHRKLAEAGVWMDPDMNKYTLSQRVTHHPTMSDEEWDSAYREFHARYYTFAHMETVLRRMVALRANREATTINRLVGYREAVRAEGVSMLESGFVRMRNRRQRRPGMKIVNPLAFYPWHWGRTLRGAAAYLSTTLRLRAILWRIERDPKRFEYSDAALTLAGGEGADLVASTRVTEHARRRMANHAAARQVEA
jgi:pyruvate-formate lyase-activating enzyme